MENKIEDEPKISHLILGSLQTRDCGDFLYKKQVFGEITFRCKFWKALMYAM